MTGSVLAVDEAAGRVDVLLDTGGVREALTLALALTLTLTKQGGLRLGYGR